MPHAAIDGREVIAAPYRGPVDRYRPSDADRSIVRTHAIVLHGTRGTGALLVVDATRRADVSDDGAVRTPVGVPVRVLSGDGGVRTLEWDRQGWGLSLTTRDLDLADALQVVDAVGLPLGPSLRSGRPPDLDGFLLDAVGLRVAGHRATPTSTVGGPIVGQAGLEAVEAHVHQPVHPPARLLLTGSLGPSVRAADLADALGTDVVVDPPWRGGGVAVALDLVTDGPVGSRITGQRRVLLDHPSGVTFWLASDELSLPELLAAGEAIDFDGIARRMTRT